MSAFALNRTGPLFVTFGGGCGPVRQGTDNER